MASISMLELGARSAIPNDIAALVNRRLVTGSETSELWGCLRWQQEGLGLPTVIKEATESYRSEVDIVGQFIEECGVLDPQAQVTADALWAEFSEWAAQNSEQMTRRVFANRLEDKGFRKARSGHDRRWTWFGLTLKSLASAPAFASPGGAVPCSQSAEAELNRNKTCDSARLNARSASRRPDRAISHLVRRSGFHHGSFGSQPGATSPSGQIAPGVCYFSGTGVHTYEDVAIFAGRATPRAIWEFQHGSQKRGPEGIPT
jgi:phage/plasmid-associated DNA primase